VLATSAREWLDRYTRICYNAWQMYPKLTTVTKASSRYQYLQLVESYRDEQGASRQRLVLNLGRVDDDTQRELARLGHGILRLLGEETVLADQLQAQETVLYGPLLVGKKLWDEVGLGEKIRRRLGRRGRGSAPVVEAILAMVLNRLVAPRSKLALARWLERVYLAELEQAGLQVQHFYRALDLLAEIAQGIEEDLFHEQRDLFEPGLDMVFYDLTSTYFEGDGPEQARWGYSRDKRSDRPQILVGLLLNRDGLPLAHKVFPGNMVDAATVPQVLDDLRNRFGLQRVIFVGDRGMVSQGNLDALEGAGYEYVIGLRKRAGKGCWEALQGVRDEDWQPVREGLRVATVEAEEGGWIVVCHSQPRGAEEQQILDSKLEAGRQVLERIAQGKRRHTEAVRRAGEALKETKAGKYFEVWLDEEGRLGYAEREEIIAHERGMLGVYFLRTKAGELTAEQAARAYMQLQDVEAAFRELKDFLKLRPIYHYKQRRVEAHVFVCVLAYLLEKLLGLKLRGDSLELSPRRALEELERVEVVTVRAGREEVKLISRPTAAGRRVLRAVGIGRLPRTLTPGTEE
jgi:transposase